MNPYLLGAAAVAAALVVLLGRRSAGAGGVLDSSSPMVGGSPGDGGSGIAGGGRSVGGQRSPSGAELGLSDSGGDGEDTSSGDPVVDTLNAEPTTSYLQPTASGAVADTAPSSQVGAFTPIYSSTSEYQAIAQGNPSTVYATESPSVSQIQYSTGPQSIGAGQIENV